MIKLRSVGCIAQLATPRSTDKPFLESHKSFQSISALVNYYIRVIIALDSLPASYIHLTVAILKRDARHFARIVYLDQGAKTIRDTHVACRLKIVLFHIIIQ